MYNSKLIAKNNYTIDDIEKQRFRVSHRDREGGDEETLRQQGYSVVESALAKTGQTITSIASFLYNGLGAIKNIVVTEEKRFRSRSARMPERSRSYEYRDSYERRQHSKRRMRTPSESSVSEQQYYTAHGRSQSRAPGRSRSRTLGPEIPSRSMNFMTQTADEIHTVSIGIQADSKSPQKLEAKHSIGVESLCIDQTLQDQTIPSVRAQIKSRQTAVVQNVGDFSRGSIATQKLNQSKLIKLEKVKRVGKRIGKKAQLILKESKHFQSSEEDKQVIEESIQQSEIMEPGPAYLRHEVQYIKMAEAFDKQDLVQYNSSMSKMKLLEKEQTDKMSQLQITT